MKSLQLVRLIFVLGGSALLAGAFHVAQSSRAFLAASSRAEGEVLALLPVRSGDAVTYKPFVRFQDAQGVRHDFESSISSYPPGYQEGERVQVIYDPRGRHAPRLDSFMALWGGPLVMGILGGGFLAAGVGMALHGRVRRLRRGNADALLGTGQRIEAEIRAVELNPAVSINGRHPWHLICHWQHPVTREIHIFESGNIWFDPSSHVQADKVPVYIDPEDPRRYHVDLSFLPKLAA